MSALIDQYNAITAALQNNILEIKFTKADGSKRVLLGTQHSSKLPPVKPLAEGEQPPTPKEQNHELIKAYDLEAQGWRSIKNVNLISYRIVESLNHTPE